MSEYKIIPGNHQLRTCWDFYFIADVVLYKFGKFCHEGLYINVKKIEINDVLYFFTWKCVILFCLKYVYENINTG